MKFSWHYTLLPPIIGTSKPFRCQQGFTILELCIALSILSFLLWLGCCELSHCLMRVEREMVLGRLKMAIEQAKAESFFRNQTISICPSRDQKTCNSHDWAQGFIVFVNTGEKKPKVGKVLQAYPKLRFGRLNFDGFGSHLFYYRPKGSATNGTFTYCPLNRNQREAEALIVNKAGRTIRVNHARAYHLNPNFTHTEEMPLTCR